MDHTQIADPAGFADLSREEQILYLQALWDRIAAEPDTVPVPEWHRKLVREELEEYRRNPGDGEPAFEVLDGLERELG